MSYLSEIRLALKTLYELNKDVVLLQCTANYPIKDNEANLSVINTYKDRLTHLTNGKEQLISDKSLTLVTKHQQLSDLLFITLKDSIFPAWYGTPWDFNGTSDLPQKGEIACGYFVSTTLKHAGFNLNRYKLAQQGATEIARAVCGKNNMKRYVSSEAILTALKAEGEGLYIVGLDYHVGFLIVEKGEVFFVHSDYFNGKVLRELAKESIGFGATQSYIVGEITNNGQLMTNWTNQTKMY